MQVINRGLNFFKRHKKLLRILGSVLFVAIIVYQIDIDQFIETARQTNIGVIFVVICITIIGTFVSAMKWNRILTKLGFEFSYSATYFSYISGLPVNMILPGTLGGDLSRSVLIARHPENSTENAGENTISKDYAIFSVVLDRIFGLFGLGLLFYFAVFFIPNQDNQLLRQFKLLVVIVFPLLGLILFILLNKASDRAESYQGRLLYKPLKSLKIIKEQFGLIGIIEIILIAVSFQILVMLQHLFVLSVLSGEFIGIAIIALVSLVNILSMFPISIQGFGLSQYASLLLFPLLDITPEIAVLSPTVIYLGNQVVNLLAAGIVTIGRRNTLNETDN